MSHPNLIFIILNFFPDYVNAYYIHADDLAQLRPYSYSTRESRKIADLTPPPCADYLEYFHDILRELHEGGVRHPPVDPIDEYARPDGVRDRAEFRLLVGLPPGGGQLPGEGRGEPFAHLRRHRVRLHLRQLVIFVRQSPTGKSRDRGVRTARSGGPRSDGVYSARSERRAYLLV